MSYKIHLKLPSSHVKWLWRALDEQINWSTTNWQWLTHEKLSEALSKGP